MVALGVETLICARDAAQVLGPQYNVIPVIPWLPAISWLAYLFGAVWVACGVGLLSRRTARTAALTLGSMLLVCALVLDVSKNAANIASITFAIWVVTLRRGLSKRRQRSCWWNFQTYAGRSGTYATCRSSLHPDIRFEFSCCSIR